MTDSDFDGSVRATLTDVAHQTPVPDGLTQRLIANAEAGRTVVTPLDRGRRRAGWTLPLLAAAAVVVVAGGALAVTNLAGSNDRPNRPGGSTGAVPTPPPPRPADAPPVDFRAATVSFRDAQHGAALGIGSCGGLVTSSCRVILAITDDSGATWRVAPVPAGLHSMFPTASGDGSCGTNGDVLGPCVDHVLFADDNDGYLYGLHEFYWTNDGGQSWHHAPAPPDDSSGAPTVNNVPTMVAADGFAYRMFAPHGSSSGGSGELQRAPVGTNDWIDISPAISGIYNSTIAATGSALYLLAGPYAGNDSSEVYRSADHGGTWTKIFPSGDGPDALAVAPGGAVAISTSDCRVFVAPDGVTFTAHDLPGGCADSGTYVAGLSSAQNLTAVTAPAPHTLRVYRSTDGGDSFVPVATFRGANAYEPTVAMLGEFGYATASEDQVDVTFDGGQHWQARPISG